MDDPAHIAGASDPFASLAAEQKQDVATYTYGQLVTPQQAPTPPAQAAAVAAAAAPPVAKGMSEVPGSAAAAPAAAPAAAAQLQPTMQPDPFAGLHGGSSMLSSSQADIQHHQQQQQLGGMQNLLSAEASTPRLLSPEPPADRDLPLFITVSEPTKREATGMLGMKGAHNQHTCLPLLQPSEHA